jgi:predicted Fe-Mo cluster-binding NifX family protein
MALGGNEVDAVVVGGIGAGAINGLSRKGIKVFKAVESTVEENMKLFNDEKLQQMVVSTCGSHSHGGGHKHSHGGHSHGNGGGCGCSH